MSNDYRTLQQIVHNNVGKRGYLADKTPDHIIRKNFAKAVEEMGEVARYIFDEKRPPAEELADVVIPLLVMAEEMGVNLPATILQKSAADVARGVR